MKPTCFCILAFLTISTDAARFPRFQGRGGTRAGGRGEGRDGGRGRGRGRQPDFTDLGCANRASLPACADRRGNAGVWICRTRPDDEEEDGDDDSKTICVSPERTIEAVDVCDVCEGDEDPVVASCPAACDCDIVDEETGVTTTGITITNTKRGSTKSKCVSIERATAVLASSSTADCCTAEV